MNDAKTISFQGKEYFDDRLYLLYLCKGTVEKQQDGNMLTVIYHEQAPVYYVWCVVTYENSPHYPAYRVDHFKSKDDAMVFMKQIEPETPLISLNGVPPEHPLSYEEYSQWKQQSGFADYDYQLMLHSPGTNHREIVIQASETFRGIR